MEVRRLNPFKSTKSTLTALILLAYTGLFLSIPLSNATLAILLAYCLTRLSWSEALASLRRQPLPLLMISSFVLLLTGLLYTVNLKTGWFALEKKLALLLIPAIALPVFRKHEVSSSLLFRSMGWICLGSSFFLLGYAGFRFLSGQDAQAFYFENFTLPLVHYVYYAMYFAVGILCLADSVLDKVMSRRFGIVILAALFIYSLGFLILVASKTGILIFIVASVFLLYRRMKDKKLFGISLAVLFVSGSLFLYVNDTTRGRFTELTENLSILTRDQLGDWQTEKITGLNMRLLFWKISVLHIIDDGLVLWGVGTGDTQDYLDALYTDPRYNRHGYVGWDTHNEWVFMFVQTGLLGVAVWAVLFAVYFRRGWKAADTRLLLFLLVTFFFSLSESILESNKGIVFFALLMTLFASGYPKVAPSSTPSVIS